MRFVFLFVQLIQMKKENCEQCLIISVSQHPLTVVFFFFLSFLNVFCFESPESTFLLMLFFI